MIVNLKVAMITEFDGLGNVKPVRFRYQDKEGLHALQIRRVIEIDKIDRQYTRYKCEVLDGAIIRQCDLRFYKNECLWALYEIR